ncbi:hypothetical protein JKP88DRAFT_275387 [Tribonema minus]|uniref:Uncharacterized protein n=1 Tax=Tribonema minus TaxID=303371 RepID=A0A835Z9T6_9STRA|nr:hypothetical protein JKP88DRAFT_275387 [Tribonema minus]
MDIMLPADAFLATGYNDVTCQLPLMVDVTCFEAQAQSREAKTAEDPERCCRDQEAAKQTQYSVEGGQMDEDFEGGEMPVKRATQRILRQYLKTGLVDEDYTPFLGSAGPPGSRRMDIVLPADAFPVTSYDDPTRHLPLMVDVTCFEAQVASRAAKTAADPERCCRDQEAAKTTHYSGHYDQNCYKLATLALGSFGSIGEQGRKLLEAVATEYASRMSVPGGARPKALKGIALARLRSALSAALHMAYSGRVMTHMAESRAGGHMEEDVGEDPEMPFGGGGV